MLVTMMLAVFALLVSSMAQSLQSQQLRGQTNLRGRTLHSFEASMMYLGQVAYSGANCTGEVVMTSVAMVGCVAGAVSLNGTAFASYLVMSDSEW